MPRSWIGRLYWLHRLTPHTCSWPLMATGVPVCPGWVVPVTAALAPDSFPDASKALTVYVCVVCGASPLTVVLVPAAVARTVVPSYTRYPATPTLSVEASQA